MISLGNYYLWKKNIFAHAFFGWGAWNPAYEGTIKLFIPIKAQGTLENKIILAQFVGLFQTMEYFKTQVIRFPFVVDSPRGKEASQESGKEILSMITDIKMLA